MVTPRDEKLGERMEKAPAGAELGLAKASVEHEEQRTIQEFKMQAHAEQDMRRDRSRSPRSRSQAPNTIRATESTRQARRSGRMPARRIGVDGQREECSCDRVTRECDAAER
jgi:hypothetical protein